MKGEGGRWSTKRKMEVVLRLLRGETLDSLCREFTVTVETLNRWRDEFLEGGMAGLKGKTNEEAVISKLEKKIGQQAMLIELYEKKDQFLEKSGGRSSKRGRRRSAG
jgi:transposase-like protein